MEDILIILFRTVVGYLVLVILMKFMGKREIGQLSLFDLLILLTIVDIMVLGIENYDRSFWYCLIPMAVIAVIQKVIAIISLRHVKFRQLVDGKESIVISKGKVQIKEMKKQRYNMDDLYIQLRQKDVRSVEEVEYAILEASGRLSVFTYVQKNEESIFPLPIIVSGKLNQTNIKKLGLSEEWVKKELEKHQISTIDKVYGASYHHGHLEIVSIENE